MHRLLPGKQVTAALALAATHIFFTPVLLPPSGFIMEPVAIALFNFMAQIILAMRKFPMFTKLVNVVILVGMHVVHPIYGIGMDEPLMCFFGHLFGFLCGLAINSDQQMLLAAVEVAKMNRRADSRLNHVIKGQCGGASAMLSGLQRMLELEGRELTAETGKMMQQIQEMLDDACDWCHSREVFVQLENETYQVCERAPHPRQWHESAAAFSHGLSLFVRGRMHFQVERWGAKCVAGAGC